MLLSKFEWKCKYVNWRKRVEKVVSKKVAIFSRPIASFSTLIPRQNGRHFPDDTFKRISVTEMLEMCLRMHQSFFLACF